MNNEIATLSTSAALAMYSKELSLVEVRSDSKRFPRICFTPEPTAHEHMCKIVTFAHMLVGKEASKETIEFIAQVLLTELLRDEDGLGTKNLSWYEVGRIIRRAAMGLEGQMYGLSAASLYKIICNYCENDGLVAQQQANQQLVEKKKQMLEQAGASAMASELATKFNINK